VACPYPRGCATTDKIILLTRETLVYTRRASSTVARGRCDYETFFVQSLWLSFVMVSAARPFWRIMDSRWSSTQKNPITLAEKLPMMEFLNPHIYSI